MNVCRVCLTTVDRKQNVSNKNIKVFEKLTSEKFIKDDRSDTICYICISQLRRIQHFIQVYRKTNKIFSELSNNGIELTQETVAILNRRIKRTLSVTSVQSTSIACEVDQCSIKQEPNEHKEPTEDSQTLESVKQEIAPIPQVTSFQEQILSIQDYTCKICDEKFSNKIYLKKHMLIHTDETCICGHCDERFSNISSLQQHIKVHIAEKVACEECAQIFFSKTNLNDHILSCHTQSDHSYEGSTCNKKIPDKVKLKNHIASHTSDNKQTKSHKRVRAKKCTKKDISDPQITHRLKQYKCDICSKTLKNRRQLYRHKKDHPRLICDICDKDLSAKSLLIRHIIGHSVKPKCEVCHKILSSNNALKRHKSVHTGEKPHTCKICNKSFNFPGELANHKDLHMGKSFKCDKCSKEFANKQRLTIHLLTHASECPFHCDRCPKTFKRINVLERHILTHNNNKKLYECPICDKKYTRHVSLTEHIQSHRLNISCKECGKSFTSYRTLSNHELVHNNRERMKCTICNQYYYKTHLKTHMKIHAKRKTFECNLCGKTYLLKATLMVHMRTHTGERPFCCENCGKTFNDTKNMGKHKKYNCKYRYDCKTCDAKFRKREEFKIHQRMHAGKAFICDLCNKPISSKTNLERHIRTQHGEKQKFSCHLCEKSFRRLAVLQSHVFMHI